MAESTKADKAAGHELHKDIQMHMAGDPLDGIEEFGDPLPVDAEPPRPFPTGPLYSQDGLRKIAAEATAYLAADQARREGPAPRLAGER